MISRNFPLAAPRLLSSLLVLLTAGGLLAHASAAERPDAAPAAQGDTVAVFGPRTLAGTASGAYHVERFSVAPAPNATYELRVVNGDGAGSGRVTGLSLKVDGTVVLTGEHLAGRNAVTRPLGLPAGAVTLEATVTGGAGSSVTVSILQVPDPTFQVLPPHRFYRRTGAPEPEPYRFTLPPSAGTPFYLRIRNGNPDGSDRVSSATVLLNGVPVVTQNELNQQVSGFIEVVMERENVLEVEVASAPGSFLEIWGRATDILPPELRITAPAPGLVTRDTEVSAAGEVMDVTATRVTVNGVVAGRTGDAFTARVPLEHEGENTLHYVAVDGAGLRTDSIRTVVRDTEPPTILIEHPADGVLTADSTLLVRGRITDRTAVTANLNGIPLTLGSDGAFRQTVALAEGVNFLSVTATDVVGNAGTETRQATRDATPPVVAFTAPAAGFITNQASVAVAGTVQDESAVTVQVNGVAMQVADGAFSGVVPLPAEGTQALAATATDGAGNTAEVSRPVIRDTQAPVVTVLAPAEGALTNALTATVTGMVVDSTAVTLTVAGVPTAVDAAGAFAAEVALEAEGLNALALVATDAAGNQSAPVVAVVRDTEAPAILWTAPADGSSTEDEQTTLAGRVTDAHAVTATLNGAPLALAEDGAFSLQVALAEGANAFAVAAADAAGNEASAARTVTRTLPVVDPLPPDPATVAPVVNRTVATSVTRAAEFLYSGEDPIQTGVAPGTIEPLRTALVRGRVFDAQMQPLGGVTVAVRNQPELGRTLTRADGAYDFVVNGGGVLSLDFTRSGYLPAQRRVDVPWQTYTAVEDVVLLQPDGNATVIELGAQGPQVARATVAADADGPRQATVLVAPGTEATLRLPDGTTQPLAALTLRATEFTVGENGRLAMPGPLPPTTMYTYAVALTADEAEGVDGEVTLSRPAPFYVENFLGFPVGTQVPVGVWDADVGAWVPEPDGRVIRIVDVVDGVARVDADGDGAPDAGALGMEPWELEELGRTYAPGTELWRAPVTDLRIRDLNMPGQVLGTDPAVPAPSCAAGDPRTLLECRAQVNVQSLPLAGTSFGLVYASDRVPGRAQSLEIQLTPASIPPELIRVELEITVAGRTLRETFPAAPDLRHSFEWDGQDAYGRVLQGTQPAVVRVGHVYPVVYQVPASLAQTFGLSCAGATVPGYAPCVLPATVNSQARQEATRWQTIHTGVGAWDAAAQQGLGGWSLSPHHAYDPMTRTLYRGDGSTRAAAGMAPVKARLGRVQFNGYSLGGPVAAPDGSVLVPASPRLYYEKAVYRVTPAGDTIRLAGSGSRAFNGYGGPARDANIVALEIALGPDGSIYVNDWVNHRVHRVAPDGTLQPFAGTGERCDWNHFAACGRDGGPATEAGTTAGPLAVGPDGSVYMAGGFRVRRVGPDGIIHTVAGVGSNYQGRDCGYYQGGYNCGDGGLATRAFVNPGPIAVGPDGRVYIGDEGRVRRIDPDGIIRRVAGHHLVSGPSWGTGDGGLATQASLGMVKGLAVAADGSVYIATDPGSGYSRLVWRVTPDGIIRIVAGHHPASKLNSMSGIALGADGSLYVSEYPQAVVTRIGLPLPGAIDAWRNQGGNNAAGPMTVAAENGRELYRFDAQGRHEATLDPVTGATLYSFAYGPDGRLASVTDRNGLVTRVERDGDGNATAVVGPYGHRTELTPGHSGALGGLTGPDGHPVQMAYGDGGLLASRTDRNGNTTSYTYDAEGRLIGQASADGSAFTLSRTDVAAGQQVSGTLPSGTGTSFRIEPLSNGGMRQVGILPSGREVVSVVTTDGKTVTTGVDGTVVTVSETPDPRYGLQAPLRDEVVRLPSGLTRTTTSARTVTLSDPANPESLTRQVDQLTVNGRTSTETYERAANRVTRVSAGGRQSVIVMDAQGRPLQQQVTGLTAVVNTFDADGRLTVVTQGTRSQRYTYDALGRVETATDAAGRTQRYTYDAAGRVLTQTLPDGRVITYGYDPAGNLVSVTPPTRPAHTFGYTPANLSERYTAPDAGEGPAMTRMFYDQDQRVREILRPDSVRVLMQYDSVGRRTAVVLPEGEVRYTYDSVTGKLAGAASPDGVQLGFGYDGGLLTEVRWTGALAGTLRNGYDTDFRVAVQRLNGDSIGYRYDGDGLLTGAGALTLTRSAQNGLLTGTTLGGIASTVTYNAFGERSGISVTSGGAPLFATSYTRDDGGRITAITETASGTTAAYAYRYDDAGRLVEVRRDGAVVESYEYDGNGNRLRAVTPLGVVTATVDAQDRLLAYGDASFSYSANGEMREKVVAGDTTRYAYDALGNLRGVVLPNGTEIQYVADAEDRRVAKKVNGVLVQGFLYQDALNPVAELDASGAVVARFVYGEAMNVPEYMVRGGITYRIVADHLGSVRMVVDAATGAVAQRIDYDSWGNVVLDSNPGFQPFGYAGGLYDAQTALVRFGARDYDARTGRWTAKDPILFDGGDGNLYGYVLQDPVNGVDAGGTFYTMSEAMGAMAVSSFLGGLTAGLTGGDVMTGMALGALGGVMTGGMAAAAAGTSLRGVLAGKTIPVVATRGRQISAQVFTNIMVDGLFNYFGQAINNTKTGRTSSQGTCLNETSIAWSVANGLLSGLVGGAMGNRETINALQATILSNMTGYYAEIILNVTAGMGEDQCW